MKTQTLIIACFLAALANHSSAQKCGLQTDFYAIKIAENIVETVAPVVDPQVVAKLNGYGLKVLPVIGVSFANSSISDAEHISTFINDVTGAISGAIQLTTTGPYDDARKEEISMALIQVSNGFFKFLNTLEGDRSRLFYGDVRNQQYVSDMYDFLGEIANEATSDPAGLVDFINSQSSKATILKLTKEAFVAYANYAQEVKKETTEDEYYEYPSY